MQDAIYLLCLQIAIGTTGPVLLYPRSYPILFYQPYLYRCLQIYPAMADSIKEVCFFATATIQISVYVLLPADGYTEEVRLFLAFRKMIRFLFKPRNKIMICLSEFFFDRGGQEEFKLAAKIIT